MATSAPRSAAAFRDGRPPVRAGTATMADYEPDELREVFRSVMRKGPSYEREDVIQAMARYLGFVRPPTRSASHQVGHHWRIRHGDSRYERSLIWRID